MSLWPILRDAFADEADGLGRISRALTIADLFTLANAVVGLMAVWFAARGDVLLASSLIPLNVVLDGADGVAARLWGGGPLGPFLDSLADLLAFGIAPAVLLGVAFPGYGWIGFAVAAFFLVGGLLRLARFEVLREDHHDRYFSGMTITGSGVLVAAAILAGLPPLVVLLMGVFLPVWMVSRVRTARLVTPWTLTGAVATLAPTFLGTFLPIPHEWTVTILVTGMTVYTFVGPFYILGRYGPTPAPDAPDATGVA